MARVKTYFEAKFQMETAHMCDILALLKPLTVADDHGENGRYEILSVYFDTHDLEFFQAKIHGLFAKIKVRLRFYRDNGRSPWQHARLEVKKRNGNQVAKHQIVMPPDFASNPDWAPQGDHVRENLLLHLKDEQVLAVLARKNLIPTVMVHYHRRALQFKGLEGMRLTFDSGIVGVHPSPAALRPDYEFGLKAMVRRVGHIFEIKSYAAPPESILHQLEIRGIQQQSFSKYAHVLLHLLERTNDSRLQM